MIMYLILFFIIGFAIAKFVKDIKKAFLIYICLSIICAVAYAPMWGLVCLGEMAFGYFVVSFNKD